MVVGEEDLLGVLEWHVITTFAPYHTFLRPNVKSIFTSIATVKISDIHDFLPDVLLITVTLERVYTSLLRLGLLFDLF